jgi:hypothetical protein
MKRVMVLQLNQNKRKMFKKKQEMMETEEMESLIKGKQKECIIC